MIRPGDVVGLLERQIAAGGCAGAAVVAARHGAIVLEHYAGQAAPELQAGPGVLWPLASISKVYTAAMIMRLVEAGELTLNTLACALLPGFVGGGREQVRLRHLLTHTSGLIYESPAMEQRLIAQTPMADLVAEAIGSALLFAPGTAFSYADYNSLLAAHMAERATGQPFAALVRDLVLAPMGLADTRLAPEPGDERRLAQVRGPLAEGTPGAMYNSAYALGLAHPAFGALATARDLLRFAQHWMPDGPRIHSEATVRAMTRDQTGGVPGQHPAIGGFGAAAPIPWGLGWSLQSASTPAIMSELASFRSFGHGGASGCHILADPAAGVVVAVVSNTHLRTGPEPWYARLQALNNCALAQLSSTFVP